MNTRCFFIVVAFALLAAKGWAANSSLTLHDLAGKSFHLNDYKGKWLIVNYWATWCPPCLDEIPDLVAFHDQHRSKDAEVIGVVFDYPSRAAVERYVDDMLMSYPVVLGNDAIRQGIGPAELLPTTYLFNPQGQLVKSHKGIVTRQQLELWIRGK